MCPAFLEQMQKSNDINLIGQFGVGFYSVSTHTTLPCQLALDIWYAVRPLLKRSVLVASWKC